MATTRKNVSADDELLSAYDPGPEHEDSQKDERESDFDGVVNGHVVGLARGYKYK